MGVRAGLVVWPIRSFRPNADWCERQTFTVGKDLSTGSTRSQNQRYAAK
jgi:hypothetical protein